MKKISASLLASDNRDVGRVCRRKRRTSATNNTAVGCNNVVNESLKSKKSAIGKSYDKYSTRWKKKRSATLIESDCRNVDSMNHRKRRTSAANKTAVGSNMGYFISSAIGPRHPPVALHAMYYTRTVFLSTDTLIYIYMYSILTVKHF